MREPLVPTEEHPLPVIRRSRRTVPSGWAVVSLSVVAAVVLCVQAGAVALGGFGVWLIYEVSHADDPLVEDIPYTVVSEPQAEGQDYHVRSIPGSGPEIVEGGTPRGVTSLVLPPNMPPGVRVGDRVVCTTTIAGVEFHSDAITYSAGLCHR